MFQLNDQTCKINHQFIEYLSGVEVNSRWNSPIDMYAKVMYLCYLQRNEPCVFIHMNASNFVIIINDVDEYNAVKPGTWIVQDFGAYIFRQYCCHKLCTISMKLLVTPMYRMFRWCRKLTPILRPTFSTWHKTNLKIVRRDQFILYHLYAKQINEALPWKWIWWNW